MNERKLKKNAKRGIVQEAIITVVLLFVIIILYLVTTIWTNGSFNMVFSVVENLGIPSLTSFLGNLWAGGTLVLAVFGYMVFAANRDEPSE